MRIFSSPISLGAAYEFLINMFAESAGKKGGDRPLESSHAHALT
jgi:hypothetical protein